MTGSEAPRMQTRMQAVRFARFGEPDVLELAEVRAPAPARGEAVVRVEAAGVNPSDVKNVAGAFPTTTLPRVPGREFAGTVIDGPAELVGRRVWGTGGDLGFARDGTHAEFVTFPAAALRERPSGLTPAQAALVPVTYVTAWAGLVDGIDVVAGETVVVIGAAGGVGSAVVQLARWRGARTIGVVRRAFPDTVPPAQRPDEVVQLDALDDAPDALEAAVGALTGGRGAEAGFDAVGGPALERHLALLAPEGRMAVIAATGGRHATLDVVDFYRRGLRLVGVNSVRYDAHAAARVLEQLAPGFEGGALAPPRVGQAYYLERAREAYEAVAAGGAGRVALVPWRTT
jgi:NADPH:quinone reductase-like Zn-dependent oxidoreductase